MPRLSIWRRPRDTEPAQRNPDHVGQARQDRRRHPVLGEPVQVGGVEAGAVSELGYGWPDRLLWPAFNGGDA